MSKYNSEEFIQYTDKKAKREGASLAFYLTSRSLLYVVLVFFAIFFIWYVVFISTHSFYAVSGVSMMPTLNQRIYTDEGVSSNSDSSYDAVYVNKLSSGDVLDIVVIKRSQNESAIIKRLMATEGDWITIYKSENADGQMQYHFHRIASGEDLTTYTNQMSLVDEESGENGYVVYSMSDWSTSASHQYNGIVYEQKFFNTFLSSYSENSTNFTTIDGVIYVQVPQGYCFYMGDNRNHSTDSREKGFVSTDCIVGEAEFVVYDYTIGNRLWAVVKFYFQQVEIFFAR